jgi:hypothetical protein
VNEHIDELAELYALGSLSEAERDAVNRHASICDVCARRLGEAETVIAYAIGERNPSPHLDRRVRAALAPRRLYVPVLFVASTIAAALVLMLLTHVRAPVDREREQAIIAMIDSHFSHAQFTPLAPDAPKAKVVYGRGRPWRLFIAQTSRAYTVAAQTPGGLTPLGTLHVSGNAAELFVPNSAAKRFILLDGSRPLANVALP